MVLEPPPVEIRPVTPDRWPDLEELFERPGPRGGRAAPGWCWCRWWRDRSDDAATNKAAMGGTLADGDVPGLLAYVDGRAQGWVAVAPRIDHPKVLSSRTLRPPDPEADGVFAITCFYVHAEGRRQGVTRALVAGAVEHARACGATAVEAYGAPSLRGTSSTDFMGAESWFTDAGFEVVGPAGAKTRLRLAIMQS